MAATDIMADDANEFTTHEVSEIQQFYDGSTILITGATGFMGQILLEKLLRSCPGIDRIYLLVRTKKSKEIEERMNDLFKGPVFDLIGPETRAKVTPIPGDVSLADLGISAANRKLLASDVNVLFHAAATVRFDEKLRTAVAINVGGTRATLALAGEMESLKAFVYVSTAYANCPSKTIDERFFTPTTDGDTLQLLCKSLTDAQLEALQPSLLGEWPNTYTFTKAAAEDVVRKYGQGLPIAVLRPSIVVNTAAEPIKGWINNLYGPSGVTTGAAVGLLKTLHCDPRIYAEIVPVDKAINCCIAVAWQVAVNNRTNQQEFSDTSADHLNIYNYVSSVERPITWGEFMRYTERGIEWPPEQSIWYYCFTLNRHRSIHLFYVVLLHLLPAILADSVATLTGRKPKLWSAYRKVHKFSNVIAYFCTQQWRFSNDNTRALWRRLNARDRRLFHFNMADVDWSEAMLHAVRGIRIYVLNEPFANVERAQAKYHKLKIVHYTLVTILSLLFFGLASYYISSFISYVRL